MEKLSEDWICTKCQTHNNRMHDVKCTKCGYSLEDYCTASIINESKKELQFLSITDRERLLYLVALMDEPPIHLNLSIKPKKDETETEWNERTMTEIEIKIKLMGAIKDQFPHISDEEFKEMLVQLNPLEIRPYFEKARKQLDF